MIYHVSLNSCIKIRWFYCFLSFHFQELRQNYIMRILNRNMSIVRHLNSRIVNVILEEREKNITFIKRHTLTDKFPLCNWSVDNLWAWSIDIWPIFSGKLLNELQKQLESLSLNYTTLFKWARCSFAWSDSHSHVRRHLFKCSLSIGPTAATVIRAQ